MKVGLAVDALSPQLTGIGRYTWMLCQLLGQHPSIDDISYYRFDSWVRAPGAFLASPKPRSLRIPRKIRKIVSRRKFRNRLFHSPNYFLPPDAERPIVTVHDLSVFHFPDMHPVERVLDFEKQFARSIAAAEHIITDSDFIRNELAAFAGIAPDRITAVPLGARAGFCRAPREGGERILRKHGLADVKYVLCVAALEPRKGLEQAIRAFDDYLDRSGDAAVLAIVGPQGWNNVALHDLLDLSERRGRVKHLGYVPEDDLPILYQNAALFLYPSMYEGFGLPPIEAMACGVPTIVSNRSCMPEVTQGASMLVEPEDIGAFSRAIERGLMDDNWRRQAVEAGLRVTSSYTWERCCDETIDVYGKVWAGYGG
jgi:alpha-1,3-rhamnosyl/mannosyltransferase